MTSIQDFEYAIFFKAVERLTNDASGENITAKTLGQEPCWFFGDRLTQKFPVSLLRAKKHIWKHSFCLKSI